LCCRYRGLCINAARGTTDVFPAPGGAWRYGMGWRCEQGEMQATGRGPCEMYAREARGQWRDKRVNPLIAPSTHTLKHSRSPAKRGSCSCLAFGEHR
jgi:hypothetical protein